MPRQHWLGTGFVLLSAVLFSAKSVLVKLAYSLDPVHAVDAVTLLALRMLFALPCFLLMLWLAHEPARRPTRRDWTGLVLAGTAGYYGASILDFEGLRYISASLERLILFMYPTLTVFLSAIFLHVPIRPRTWLAIVTSYAGMLLVFAGDVAVNSPHLWLGSLLVFGGALAYAGYLVASGVLMRAFGAARFTALALTIASLCCVLHFVTSHSINTLAVLPFQVWLLSAALGFFCTFVPANLMTQGIKRIGASRAALIGAVGPVFTLGMSAVYLNEEMAATQMAGGMLVLAGVILISVNPAGKRGQPAGEQGTKPD